MCCTAFEYLLRHPNILKEVMRIYVARFFVPFAENRIFILACVTKLCIIRALLNISPEIFSIFDPISRLL